MSWLYILIGILIVLSVANLFFGRGGNSAMSSFLLLGAGLVLGALIFFLTKKAWFNPKEKTSIQSNVVLQSIEKVFKVVSAEGTFSELYNFEETSHFLSMIPSTKKALLVVNAKVLMGYDFTKCELETDAEGKIVRILKFPEPEILSIEPDISYYNLENGLLNKFSKEDMTKMQVEAKDKIIQTAKQSELPKIASKQMKTLLTELVEAKNWSLEGTDKLMLSEPSSLITTE